MVTHPWQAFPSGWSTGVNSVARSYVDAPESLGRPGDAPATDLTANNSAFSLLAGMASLLGIPAGTGSGDTNDNAKVYADPLRTLGQMNDAAATDTGTHSAISILKGILAQIGGA